MSIAKLVSRFPRPRPKLLEIIFQSPHLRPALHGTEQLAPRARDIDHRPYTTMANIPTHPHILVHVPSLQRVTHARDMEYEGVGK